MSRPEIKDSITAIDQEIMWHIESANNPEYTRSLEYRLLQLARAVVEDYYNVIRGGEPESFLVDAAGAYDHHVRSYKG